MKAVTASERLPTLVRYEEALKKRYPDEMREAYARILTEQAAAVSNRKQNQELTHRYGRRRSMMEELRNAGV